MVNFTNYQTESRKQMYINFPRSVIYHMATRRPAYSTWWTLCGLQDRYIRPSISKKRPKGRQLCQRCLDINKQRCAIHYTGHLPVIDACHPLAILKH